MYARKLSRIAADLHPRCTAVASASASLSRKGSHMVPRLVRIRSHLKAAPDDKETLQALDALLGDDEAPPHPDQQLIPWWSIKPRQSSPPRRTLMQQPSDVSRFMALDAAAPYASRVRSGRGTLPGAELDLPQSQPYFCYLLLAAQLLAYTVGTWLAVSCGPETAEAWALALALEPGAALDGERWRLLTSLLLHGGLTHLAVDTALIGWSGPGIEALLGHGVFLYVWALSGAAGAAAVMLTAAPGGVYACASAGAVGLVGAMVGFELRNHAIVSASLAARTSKAEDGRAGSAALRKPLGAFGGVLLLLALGGMPGSMVSNAGHAAGLLAGVLLGHLLGPHFSLVQEVDIPPGAMSVPDDAPCVHVVVDKRGGSARLLTAVATGGGLAAVIALCAAVCTTT